jgi:hypothetical protein
MFPSIAGLDAAKEDFGLSKSELPLTGYCDLFTVHFGSRFANGRLPFLGAKKVVAVPKKERFGIAHRYVPS